MTPQYNTDLKTIPGSAFDHLSQETVAKLPLALANFHTFGGISEMHEKDNTRQKKRRRR
jgi:hypothetical protein